jgi:hypothetical protein
VAAVGPNLGVLDRIRRSGYFRPMIPTARPRPAEKKAGWVPSVASPLFARTILGKLAMILPAPHGVSRMRHLLCGLLICTPTLAQDPKTPATKERYEALIREYDAAEEAWLKRSDGGGDTVARRAWPGSSFAPRFLELAEAAPDDPAATDALLWVANRAMNVGAGDERLYPHYCRAIKLLAQGRHLDDARVGRACTQGLRYASGDLVRALYGVSTA